MILRTCEDSPELMSFHTALQRATQRVKDYLFCSILYMLVTNRLTILIATIQWVEEDSGHCVRCRRYAQQGV